MIVLSSQFLKQTHRKWDQIHGSFSHRISIVFKEFEHYYDKCENRIVVCFSANLHIYYLHALKMTELGL